MYGKENGLNAALATAFVLVSVAALTLVLTASLLARAGMPFMAAYTVSILAAIIGTLAASHGEGRTYLALPSPAITAWLVYEEVIARGLSWQEMLGIAAVASILGALLMRTRCAGTLLCALPPIVRTGLILGLGLTMLVTAALYARILLPSPWALMMAGTLSDPLTYYTLIGILLVLLLHTRQVRQALPLGMALVALITWIEGFWEIPATPFFAPDVSELLCTLTLPQTEIVSSMTLCLTLLLALIMESMAVLTVCTDRKTEQPIARLFTISGAAALIGAFPLTIAPISLVPPIRGGHRIAGIPLAAVMSALILLLLLPCAPLMQAVADFPAVPAMALASTGLLLLVRALRMLNCVEDFTLREGAVIAVFLLAACDIKTGLTAALFTWTLLTSARGESIAPHTWGLTTLFALFFLLKWIT